MVKITFFDLSNRSVSDGPFTFVQVTRDLLRDDGDRTIATFDETEAAWLRVDDESGYYTDFVIESESAGDW